MRPGDGDPIRQLNLTPEQREQIRAIREHNQNERAVTAQKLREANRALEQALNVENPDEAVVEQRLKDVADAQASQTRMRVLTEIRIRRVLTAEQRVLLRSLQEQARENRRQRMLPNPEDRMQQREERMRRVEERRNGVNQLQRRRDNQNRIP
jgi:Spy/CpxP family protein refolding chaperone